MNGWIKELAELKWDVNQYIQYGQENAINGTWVKQLENASARFHISRLEALKLQTQQSIEVMFGNQLDSIDNTMRNVYKSGYYHTAYEIQKGVGVGWDFSALDDKQISKVINKPCGDNKQKFKLVYCHSAVATNLENLKLLAYLKYTDAQGIERDLEMGTWNGRLVIIDDSLPTKVVEAVAEDTGKGIKAQDAYTEYTTYILGEGAIGFEDVGAKVPYEMVRDAKTRGGEDTLISRKRHAVSVSGVSYLKADQKTNSPTNTELGNGKNWSLVASDTKTIEHKAVPIARIISRG